ncbi:MAG: GspB domain-containing protein [Gammaproteobacteria bacterium]|nr:GspB domain-containing protein [Gammaproteobacteria bacterium]
MSFILDALRKSEAERQRNRAPGVADMQRTGTKQSRSLWLPLAALLAGLNIALLALLWFNNERSPDTVPAAPATAPMMPAATVAADDTARSLSDEMAMDEPARYAAIAPPDSLTQPAADDIEIPPAPVSRPAPVSSDRMLTVTEAMLNGSLKVQPLRLELHVYSDKPSERFVFINTSRYAEGDKTREGAIVRAINEEGVILSFDGRNFLLARE